MRTSCETPIAVAGGRSYELSKRILDVVGALAGILTFAPLLILIGIVIRSASPGPVFYLGLRSGRDGHTFRILKFRTMVPNAELIGGPSTALNDPRLTKVGKWLRKFKLDELPQLLNILAGDMSFVGPRPQVLDYTRRYEGEEKLILSVKPGLTDYASLKFINLDEVLGDGNVDEQYAREIEPEKNRLRLLYVKRRSFAEDMRILVGTMIQILRIKRRWSSGH